MIKRDEALELVKKNVDNVNLIKHMLACESCMRGLAKHFNQNEEEWALAGLLHDLDYRETAKEPQKHGYITLEILKGCDVTEDILDAILAHPGHKERKKLIEKVLYSVDPLTGLIVAATLMHPEKKIEKIDLDFILRRFKEKRFAAGANREQIQMIEETGLKLEDFIQICLDSMKSIAGDLGL
ncbi:MAG: HDIG domain-containing protein [bacterium]|uniref:Metal dependent phosphohydrolase n=2 Tax=Bacteria candidate phyla TaxID=1783234 RepID=A0A101I2Y5_UNCT6|nr:MAG: Metal dependent phosphohydrolase [candidate division TA06 bacterium 32_111]KUK87668.1 MAG: Metal dependent phosphohydrolase [candidate division TA06 bacterium 34_109]MDI6699802.1 HDIG domain-containing protein [bacterium]HAF07507.1 phosphohydrolase [candidate division WOR-3 bacterium]HCP17576.1 phosphohydrolase [candidate division WOR-3 bacterium]